MSADTNFLIIGGGLAGSILGWRLLSMGASILIVDNNPEASASRVAAGLINPITGKRLVKSANFEPLHAEALHLYRDLESEFAQNLYFDMPLIRLFRSEEGIKALQKRGLERAYIPYIGEPIKAGKVPFNAPFGGTEILKAGYLDTNRLLDTLHQYFLQKGLLQQISFDYEDLIFEKNVIRWGDCRPQRVIFCEGYQMASNPWFNYLPLQSAKGEVLSVEIDGLNLKQIVNGGHWLIPRQDGHYRIGATHSWQDLDGTVTDSERKNLLAGFHSLVSGDYSPRVIGHKAGVRPATRDRQPFIGIHPQHPQLAIFNGFGAKGSLLIPWYSKQFAACLSGHGEILAAADIQRFE